MDLNYNLYKKDQLFIASLSYAVMPVIHKKKRNIRLLMQKMKMMKKLKFEHRHKFNRQVFD